jgi:hypothetical protein
MLEKLISLFKGSTLGHPAKVIFQMSTVLELLEEKYVQDKNARDALIDTCIQILENHKTNSGT